jgi:hypothetical protein
MENDRLSSLILMRVHRSFDIDIEDFMGVLNALPPSTSSGQCPVRRVLGEKLPKLREPAISGF